jgi:hypothetical protein
MPNREPISQCDSSPNAELSAYVMATVTHPDLESPGRLLGSQRNPTTCPIRRLCIARQYSGRAIPSDISPIPSLRHLPLAQTRPLHMHCGTRIHPLLILSFNESQFSSTSPSLVASAWHELADIAKHFLTTCPANHGHRERYFSSSRSLLLA